MQPDAPLPTSRLPARRLAPPRKSDRSAALDGDPGVFSRVGEPPPPPPWQALIEAMLHAVWLVDRRALRIVAVNGAAARLAGVDAESLVGRPVSELVASPEDVRFWAEVRAGVADSIESETLVMRGEVAVPILRRVSLLAGFGGPADGGDGLYVVALHDRSPQLGVQRALEAAAADLRATLESTQDGLLVTDLSGRIRNFNRRFAALWDMPDELLRRADDDAVLEWMRRSVRDSPAYMRRLAAIDEATLEPATDVLQLKSGKVIERVTLPQLAEGRAIGRVVSFRDVTAVRAAERRIQTLVHTDALTGLPNRRRLADRIEQSLALARRDGTPFALLFINLDRFNHINESFGHDFGDRVLRDVAGRIKACLRQVDTAARLGGDEFVVLACQADEAGAERTGARLIDALKRPFSQGDVHFTVTASVGIALYPTDGADMDELVRRSDAAMREVKVAGRAGFRFHQPRTAQADAQPRQRMQLDHAMREGLRRGRFRLEYQPQVDLTTGRVVGAEALLRWRDPERGEVSPAEFIPVAEASGFILRIDQWVMRAALRQAARWFAAGTPVPLSINLSGLQFQQPGFVDEVAALLREGRLPAQLIELELTESILIRDAPDAMLRLQALSQLGVRLAIDDFGVGYSSLAYLKRFPIQRLKIDRSFIRGLPSEESDVGIVEAVINLGRALRLQVVAEGVETEVQRDFLQRLGCDHYQGWLFAPALSPEALGARIGLSPANPPAPPAHGDRTR